MEKISTDGCEDEENERCSDSQWCHDELVTGAVCGLTETSARCTLIRELVFWGSKRSYIPMNPSTHTIGKPGSVTTIS
ncbi:hypothetical protein Q1695_012745 [Nippostrongylus brasiliensis]|nr:hypothetical protein Q1695_012745 [Nippostrongylus brasiliensis]